MFKKSCICLFLVVFSLISTVGFAQEKTLSIISRLWSTPNEQGFIRREILEPYAKKNGIRISMEVLNDDLTLKKVTVQKTVNNLDTDIIISHSGYMPFWIQKGWVENLNPLMGNWDKRTILPAFSKSTSKDGKTYFIPIAADVYLLIANKKALPFLPKGADINNLTWDQFVQWAINMKEKTGRGKLALVRCQR